MGLFDVFKGGKDKGRVVVLKPANGGYTLESGTGSNKISRVCVLYSSTAPVEDEPELIKGVLRGLDASIAPAPGAAITTAHETLPDIDEFVATREMPDSLNTFLMSRVMMLGLARGPAEMAKLAIEPFSYMGVKGVAILKET
jgi:hypothetical protein